MSRRNALLLLLAMALLLSPGCKKGPGPDLQPDRPTSDERSVDDAREAMPPPPPREEVRDPGWREEDPESRAIDTKMTLAEMSRALRTIYFGYDSFDLSSTSLATLRDNAEWLKAHPELRVLVQGHCDERGTIEYNLALGERRASSVRDYLTKLGVPRSAIRIITYGEERPVDPGHTESAWSKNRRAEFVLER